MEIYRGHLKGARSRSNMLVTLFVVFITGMIVAHMTHFALCMIPKSAPVVDSQGREMFYPPIFDRLDFHRWQYSSALTKLFPNENLHWRRRNRANKTQQTRIDEYFDEVYLLNLEKRPERMDLAAKRMQFCDIEFRRFAATDGSVMKRVWETYFKENRHFLNPNYMGCAISHLSIYKDALEKGFGKILVVEDDNRILYDANRLFSSTIDQVPEWELLYLGFIPLTDDASKWDYNVFEIVDNHIARARNFWGLFAYGITSSLMNETLAIYEKDFPMELDRYFVTHVQPRRKSYGIIPQVFAADDGLSDNSKKMEQGMLERSIDSRFAKVTDYI